MRHKRLLLNAIILSGLELTGSQAQTMYLIQSNGTQTAYALNSVRKMTFSGGNATILKTDNSTGVYALNGLRFLNFEDLTTNINEQPMQSGNSQMLTYPNPVADVLNIDLRAEDGTGILSIITLEGKVMQTQHTSGNGLVPLQMSHLPKGIYLCQYQNENTIKTVKILKQ
ncbi:MAG TPA: T9SS type A sorting domain-containing protein [Bacteroidales bacterium]|nr:T9SS type A sorting domain-containing protein [Bacteroidales bacterium]HQI70225.1 T9SS type A sorting domain-containing protein [Bacteroidales bacterium]